MDETSSISLLESQAAVHCVSKALLYVAEMTLGKRIRAVRKRLGITQILLGEKCGVSKQAVHQWEMDDKRPDSSHLMPLSQALGVPVAWLLDGAGDPPALDYQQRIEALSARERALLESVLSGFEGKRGKTA